MHLYADMEYLGNEKYHQSEHQAHEMQRETGVSHNVGGFEERFDVLQLAVFCKIDAQRHQYQRNGYHFEVAYAFLLEDFALFERFVKRAEFEENEDENHQKYQHRDELQYYGCGGQRRAEAVFVGGEHRNVDAVHMRADGEGGVGGVVDNEVVGGAVGLVADVGNHNEGGVAFVAQQTAVDAVESVVVVGRHHLGEEQPYAQQQQTDENGVDNTQVPKVFVYVVHFLTCYFQFGFAKLHTFFELSKFFIEKR